MHLAIEEETNEPAILTAFFLSFCLFCLRLKFQFHYGLEFSITFVVGECEAKRSEANPNQPTTELNRTQLYPTSFLIHVSSKIQDDLPTKIKK